MPLLIDSENIISDIAEAPDKLRAQIGQYYTKNNNGNLRPPRDMSDGRIKRFEIVDEGSNEQLLIPTQKHKILIVGDESRFRDYNQWNEFVNSTIAEGGSFLDHQVNFREPTVNYDFMKNFHHPEYEDLTKEFDSNQLLSYNLLSYKHRNDTEEVKRIGQLRTRFDVGEPTIQRLLEEFENRISNYEGEPEEIITKQRNIFILRGGGEITFDIIRGPDGKISSPLPYAYAINIGRFRSSTNEFKFILNRHKKLKNIFQSIKRDLSFNTRNFTTAGNTNINAKLYNGISLLASTSLSTFSENSDELFLLRGEDMDYSDLSNRFINQINSVRFLSEFRNELLNNTRDLHDIFRTSNSEYVVLGYKIEKYLDNTVGSPIQTFYTTNARFVDTQLKYGRRYVYITKALVCVFGSDYRYANLNFSREELQETPTDFQVSGEKYWATVNVDVRPSFQILEYAIDTNNVSFVDSPTLAPHVEIYGRKNESCVNFLFRPKYNSIGQSEAEDLTSVGNLRPGDQTISDLYDISGEKRTSHIYFTGIYEIYRMTSPPRSKSDFANHYLTTVDQKATYEYISQSLADEEVDMTNAFLKNTVIPNKKYYYAFRALTYHGTPSELTEPIVIEVMKDSDEYKISSEPYIYPLDKSFVFEKNLKRLLRIVPNPERLSIENIQSQHSWDLDEGSLATVKSTAYKTFKIRVTSKHSGKKMDLNITFKVKKDDSFN